MISISPERLSTYRRFETEALGNSEMAYYVLYASVTNGRGSRVVCRRWKKRFCVKFTLEFEVND